AFHGATASGDPQAFRGRSASAQFDNFVRGSSGVTTGGVTSYNANQTRAYYGDSRNVPPPAGTVGISTTGGYSPPVPTAWRSVDPRTSAVSNGTTAVINRPGDLAQPGAVDNIYAPNAVDVSALPVSVGNPAALSDYTQLNTTTIAQFTPSQIKQMQSEDSTPRLPGQTPLNGTNSSPTDPAQQQPLTSSANSAANSVNSSPNAVSANTPAASPMANQATIDNSVSNSVTPSNGAELGTIVRMAPKVAMAGQPDKSGAAAAQAGDAPKRPGQAAEEASRAFAKERAQQAKADANKTDAAKPADTTAKPSDTAKPAGPPPKVASFAGQATNQNISELLTKAEQQVKEGKYGSAIDTYGAAEAASPRNATVKLGRANAELGGTYYRRAEQSLRGAFGADKKLLANQYDLRAFLGDDRLQTIQKDLSDLVQNKPNETGSAVLLAYVYYNTGNERRAAALLDLADKRAQGRDALIRSMKASWTYAGEDTK
ncbi:MAG: repeat protein, partial [Phycisphaerales bacterium]|nr:repeat protein [Phycisphaerales bacterium]